MKTIWSAIAILFLVVALFLQSFVSSEWQKIAEYAYYQAYQQGAIAICMDLGAPPDVCAVRAEALTAAAIDRGEAEEVVGSLRRALQ